MDGVDPIAVEDVWMGDADSSSREMDPGRDVGGEEFQLPSLWSPGVPDGGVSALRGAWEAQWLALPQDGEMDGGEQSGERGGADNGGDENNTGQHSVDLICNELMPIFCKKCNKIKTCCNYFFKYLYCIYCNKITIND